MLYFLVYIMALKTKFFTTKQQSGFTIVELLIVIVVISILAAIALASYNGVQNRARESKRDSDVATYYKAILVARNNTGMVLKDITVGSWSVSYCTNATYNPGSITPKDLPKTHPCWINYYDNLDKVSAASGINLSSLKSGDSNGNPYSLDENEGEFCGQDIMYYFTGSGAGTAQAKLIPLSKNC